MSSNEETTLFAYRLRRHPLPIVTDFYKKYWLECDYLKDIGACFDGRDVSASSDASGACSATRQTTALSAGSGSELASLSTL